MIITTNWAESQNLIKPIRYQVFIVEQQIPEEEEWDDDDFVAIHALAFENNIPIATGRLIIDEENPAYAKIGRIAVLENYRSQGYGRAVLKKLIDLGKEKGVQVFTLHAQVSAISFYISEGFVSEGPIFDEVNIPHQKMILRI
jgi:predicted GNAT family N-acyltransferase